MRKFYLLIAAGTAVALFSQANGTAYADGIGVDSGGFSTMNVPDDLATVLGQVTMPVVIGDGSGATTEVELPASAEEPAELDSPAGVLTMRVPAAGADLNRRQERGPGVRDTARFEGDALSTAFAVKDTGGGLQALVQIDSAEAPERFDFQIGGDVASLKATSDGSVQALDATGDIVATAPAPWASDANGAAVPTHYEVNGTTLTQVVEHKTGDYAYGIVADPWWNPFSWDWGKIWRKSKRAVASALKKCGEGALVSTLGLAVGTGTTNVLITKYGSKIAKVKVGGVYGYVGVAAAGCIMNNL